MQKVLAGNIGKLSEFADFLNQQLQKNPGWKIDKIYQIHQKYSVGAVVVFVGPDGTEGPSMKARKAVANADGSGNSIEEE